MYEVCLTNMLRRIGSRAESRRFYFEFCCSNVVFYVVFLSIGGDEYLLVILCCFFEWFLCYIIEGVFEVKLIKGTCKCFESFGGVVDRVVAFVFECNVKDCVENLMIVDLL